MLGNHPCLLPVDLALPESPRRDSVCCQQVVRFLCCYLHVVDPRFQLVFWDFVEARVAVCVMVLSSCSLGSWWLGSVGSQDRCRDRGVRRRRFRQRSRRVQLRDLFLRHSLCGNTHHVYVQRDSQSSNCLRSHHRVLFAPDIVEVCTSRIYETPRDPRLMEQRRHRAQQH